MAVSTVTANNMLFYRAAGVIALRDGISLEEAQTRLRPMVETRNGRVDYDAMMAQGAAILRANPLLTLHTQVTGALTLLLGFGDGVFTRMLYEMPDASSPSIDLFRLPLRQHLERWLLSKPLPFVAFLLSAIQLAMLYLGVLCWWGKMFWCKHRIASIHFLLWAVILYLIIVTSGPEANSRFRVPIAPLLALYGGAGVYYVGVQVGRAWLIQR
jgi:hypothetical protein